MDENATRTVDALAKQGRGTPAYGGPIQALEVEDGERDGAGTDVESKEGTVAEQLSKSRTSAKVF